MKYRTTCDDCGVDTDIPFAPDPRKRVRCRACLRAWKAAGCPQPYSYTCMECGAPFSLAFELPLDKWTLCRHCKNEQRQRHQLRQLGLGHLAGTSSRKTFQPGIGIVKKTPVGPFGQPISRTWSIGPAGPFPRGGWRGPRPPR